MCIRDRYHALRPVAGVQLLGDLLIGDGSGLDLVNGHGAVFIGENAVCPAFQRKGDAAGFPLRAEEYLGLIALPGGLLQLAVDACTLVGAVKAGKAAVDTCLLYTSTALAPSSAASSTAALCAACSGVSLGRP